PTAGLLAEEPCLQDFGIVEDQQVARFEKAGQIREMAIGEGGRSMAVIHVEQTARAALGERRLRDQLGRQIKIEVGKREHEGSIRETSSCAACLRVILGGLKGRIAAARTKPTLYLRREQMPSSLPDRPIPDAP